MKPKFSLKDGVFAIENYNQARPFSSFLPGIAGEFGKPMWVFYTNRGQCISSFGVRNKNASMLEFYPANKAYAATPLLGFRTFIHRFKKGGAWQLYEPFQMSASAQCRQTLSIRAHEIELEETNRALGLRVSVVLFNAPQEDLPVLVRQVRIENIGKQAFKGELLDGLQAWCRPEHECSSNGNRCRARSGGLRGSAACGRSVAFFQTENGTLRQARSAVDRGGVFQLFARWRKKR